MINGSVLGSELLMPPVLPSGLAYTQELNHSIFDIQFSSVTQSRPNLCDSMNCSTPGLPVHHQIPEFTQTHVMSIESFDIREQFSQLTFRSILLKEKKSAKIYLILLYRIFHVYVHEFNDVLTPNM